MDPDAALKGLLDALRADNREDVKAYALALHDWIRRGGFLPTDPRQKLEEALLTALPYVEEAEKDPCYKPGVVRKATQQIRALVT